MRFRLLAMLTFVFLQFLGNAFAANYCGTQSGLTWTFTGNFPSPSSDWCAPASNGTQTVTVNSGVSVASTNYSSFYFNNSSVNLLGLTNLGTIGGTNASIEVSNGAQVATITNGSVSNTSAALSGAQAGITNTSASGFAGIGTVNNYGSVSGMFYGFVNNTGTMSQINNYVGATISDTSIGYGAIYNGGSIASIINNGTVTGNGTGGLSGNGSSGIYNDGGTITTIVNTGTIQGVDHAIANMGNGATIGTITNWGTLTGAYSGINNNNGLNNAVITTINNAQNGLTYIGVLPTYYNVIITGSSYGTLNGTGQSSGSTLFGVSSLSTLRAGAFAGVLTGGFSTSAGLSNSGASTGRVTGSISNYNWTLTYNTGTSAWDLLLAQMAPSGPSAADTQASLQNTAASLQNIYTLQNSVLANSFSYDCTVFGANNVCVSAGGRNTAVSAANGLNNTSALLIAGYRINNNYRIGAYADQNLSVNNAGSTVNLGNNTPLIGIFGAWSERLDGTGAEVKVSAAYGQKNTTITRSVVGAGATASEAGSGGSQLNSQGAQVVAKYGFGFVDQIVVSPYAGIRYTQNNMGGYTEGTSSSVTAPLTYSALNTNATTALAGVGASYRGIPQTTLFASAGVESDTNTANGTYSATGVTGLTPVNFNANPVKTRATATVGANYDVAKNQRLGITGIYRQEPYQAVQTTTLMATYTVGL